MSSNHSSIHSGECDCKIMNTNLSVAKKERNKSTGILADRELFDPNICRIHSLTFVKNNFLIQMLERFYEVCATFNIRYCPFRSSLRNKHCVVHTLKDFIVLLCFFAANFIVFLVIITRMAVHISYMLVEGLRWAQRCLTSTLSETRLAALPKPSWHQTHFYKHR